jgi:hypothetical protein
MEINNERNKIIKEFVFFWLRGGCEVKWFVRTHRIMNVSKSWIEFEVVDFRETERNTG